MMWHTICIRHFVLRFNHAPNCFVSWWIQHEVYTKSYISPISYDVRKFSLVCTKIKHGLIEISSSSPCNCRMAPLGNKHLHLHHLSRVSILKVTIPTLDMVNAFFAGHNTQFMNTTEINIDALFETIKWHFDIHVGRINGQHTEILTYIGYTNSLPEGYLEEFFTFYKEFCTLTTQHICLFTA